MLRYGAILRFHAPVAATILSYGIVFNTINSSMARAGAGAASTIAAFAVAQSLVDLWAAPAGMCNMWVVARGRDRASLRVGARVIAQLVLAISSVLALVGWTPLGRWVYGGVFGAPEHLYGGINAVVRLCLPMPFVWGLRNCMQAILMIRKQTHLMAVGVFIRLVWVLSFAAVLARFPVVDGPLVGGVLWMSGMAVETVFMLVVARRNVGMLPERPENGNPAVPAGVRRFLLPLIAMSFLWAMARPMANALLARTASPETSIAAFQVTWWAAFLLFALETDYRQAVVVFWNDGDSLTVLRRFGLGLGFALAAAMAVLGATGGSAWFLANVLGTPAELASVAGRLFLVISPVPVFWICTELFAGQLLRNGTTGQVGIAKAANLSAMAVVMFCLAAAAPEMGPLVGAVGLVAGYAVELVTIVLRARSLGTQPLPDSDIVSRKGAGDRDGAAGRTASGQAGRR